MEEDLLALSQGVGPGRGRRRLTPGGSTAESTQSSNLPGELMQLMDSIYRHPYMQAALTGRGAGQAGIAVLQQAELDPAARTVFS